MTDSPWLMLGVSAGVNVISYAVAYGALRANVKASETRITQLELDNERLQSALNDHRLSSVEQFVSYEAFRELKREMIEGQNKMDAKIDKVLDAVMRLGGKA